MFSFSSLQYLTLKDISYFNCNWMKDISAGINVNSNMCKSPLQVIELLIYSILKYVLIIFFG